MFAATLLAVAGVVGTGGEGDGDVGVSVVELFGVNSCGNGSNVASLYSLSLYHADNNQHRKPLVVSSTLSLSLLSPHQSFVSPDHATCFSQIPLALVIAGAVAKGASPPWDPRVAPVGMVRMEKGHWSRPPEYRGRSHKPPTP